MTTEWIDVEPSTSYRLNFTKSNKRRFQSKNTNGVISYRTDISSESLGADGFIFTTLPDAIQFRLYFQSEPNYSQPVTGTITKL